MLQKPHKTRRRKTCAHAIGRTTTTTITTTTATDEKVFFPGRERNKCDLPPSRVRPRREENKTIFRPS